MDWTTSITTELQTGEREIEELEEDEIEELDI